MTLKMGQEKVLFSLPYGINLGLPPGMLYYFWFTASTGRCSSSGFHLTFSTIIALSPHDREPMWAFCQLLSMSIPIKPFGDGKITTRWI
jgi:hypothetical protein